MVSVLIAILLPLYSTLSPLSGLLVKSISGELDKDRSKASSVRVTIENLGKKFPWSVFNIALGSTIVAFTIYIFLPLGLISGNLTLIIVVFFGLLLAMLVGVMLILLNFSYFFEWMLLIPLFLERKYIRTMVRMNLVAHRLQNRRTVIIYSLSLAFIIFIFVTSTMQSQSATKNDLKWVGSEITIFEGEEGPLIVGNVLDIMKWDGLGEKVHFGLKLRYLV